MKIAERHTLTSAWVWSGVEDQTGNNRKVGRMERITVHVEQEAARVYRRRLGCTGGPAPNCAPR
jgi:hypothetical protein